MSEAHTFVDFHRASVSNAIWTVTAGSHLYGLNTPESDLDIVSIWVPDQKQLLGLHPLREFRETSESDGTKIETIRYPLHLFVQHAWKCNPNILEVLFVPSKYQMIWSEDGQALVDIRHHFLSRQKILDAFLGYAQSQRKKLTAKRERLDQFRTALARASEWKAEGLEKVPERYTVLSGLNDKGYWRIFEKNSSVEEMFRSVVAALEEYGWRKELIEKYGFDTKFGAHIIRLLEEGRMLLAEGALDFPLSNSDELRSIRNGSLTLDQVLALSEERERMVREAYKDSCVPECGDFDIIENKVVYITLKFWNKR